jgi:hypothetical protein
MLHLISKLTYINQAIKDLKLDLQWTATADITADVLTKPLQGAPHSKHVTTLMGYSGSSSSNK